MPTCRTSPRSSTHFVPPAAFEQGGVEVLRAVIVDGALTCRCSRAFDDPEAWGMLIADITRHVSRIYAGQVSEGETVERILARCYDAEVDAPTDPGTTSALVREPDMPINISDARAVAHDGEGQSRQVAQEGRRQGQARAT